MPSARTSSCPSATTRSSTARARCWARCPATPGGSSPTCAPTWATCGPTRASSCCSWAASSARRRSGRTSARSTGSPWPTPTTRACRPWWATSTGSTASTRPCGSRTASRRGSPGSTPTTSTTTPSASSAGRPTAGRWCASATSRRCRAASTGSACRQSGAGSRCSTPTRSPTTAPTSATWAWSRPRRSSGTASRPRAGSRCRRWPPCGSLRSEAWGSGGLKARPPVNLGPRLVEGGAELGVWAPRVRSLAVRAGGRTVPMEREDRGVWRGSVEGVAAGDDYLLVLDGERERPDPRSRFQPHGVHGPSRLVDLGPPPDRFATPALEDLVFYELHCGTFTPEGTFDAAIGRLGHLRELGVTAVEVMPVAAFPGDRGWGYDGVALYAVHAAYGGPAAFRRFVDACHAAGLAVILDVVYNHLGPDGNYLGEFGPYFTDRFATPWGDAVNLDGPGSDFVRDFLLDNAEQWLAGYGLDGLRLDAVHHLHDQRSVHILEELAA